MMAKQKLFSNGFIALISAIIISFLLLTVVLTAGFSGFFVRLNILDAESKERSLALAEACVNVAILNLINNKIQTAQSIMIGPDKSDQCIIISAIDNGDKKIIKTQAVVNKTYTNFKVIFNQDFSVFAWEECVADYQCS